MQMPSPAMSPIHVPHGDETTHFDPHPGVMFETSDSDMSERMLNKSQSITGISQSNPALDQLRDVSPPLTTPPTSKRENSRDESIGRNIPLFL